MVEITPDRKKQKGQIKALPVGRAVEGYRIKKRAM